MSTLIANTQPDGQGDAIYLIATPEGKLITNPNSALSEAWYPQTLADVGTNEVLFTVETGKKWKIGSIYVIYIASTSVGNRRLTIEVLNPAGDTVFFEERVGIDQPASTTRTFTFAPGFTPGAATFVDTNFIQCGIPNNWVLPEEYILKVYDRVDVDGVNDDVTVYLNFESQSMIF